MPINKKHLLFFLLYGYAALGFAFTISDAQNSSFSGENLLTGGKNNSLVISELAAESTVTNKKTDLTTDFALPIHNGVVDLSDKTHVRVYSNGASLQMQY